MRPVRNHQPRELVAAFIAEMQRPAADAVADVVGQLLHGVHLRHRTGHTPPGHGPGTDTGPTGFTGFGSGSGSGVSAA